MEKKQKFNKNIFLSIVIILSVIIVLSFVLRNNIEAIYKGVDVKYIEDPLYCEDHNDCTATIDCEPINIYNYNNESGVCEDVIKSKSVVTLCYPEGCKIDRYKLIGDSDQ